VDERSRTQGSAGLVWRSRPVRSVTDPRVAAAPTAACVTAVGRVRARPEGPSHAGRRWW